MFPLRHDFDPDYPGDGEGHGLWPGEHHEVACGALHLTYTHNSGEEPEQETVEAVAAIVAGYETPRCIQVGSNAQDVLSEYENALVYLLKESAMMCSVPTTTAMPTPGGRLRQGDPLLYRGRPCGGH